MSQGQDQTLKFISNEYLKEFINMLPTGIDFKIDENTEFEILTEEQIVIEPSLYRPDFIARIGNIILMLEFQSTFVGITDKKRFKSYIANFDLKNNKENRKIIFAVISTAEYSKFTKYKINNWDLFTFPIISLYNKNVGEIISNIKEKINNQESFDEKELIEFSLTPIMHRSRENIINQFKQNVELMNQINYNNKQIRNSTYGIAIMLSNMYFAKDDPMRKEIQGDYMMKVDCVNEAIKESYDAGLDAGKLEGIKEGKLEGIKEGKLEGIKEGKIEMIIDLFNSGKFSINDVVTQLSLLNCDLKTISHITGLSENKINEIKNQD